MRCFEHSDREAVGVCRACGRAVCPDCVELVENRLACRGVCQNEVERELRVLTGSEMVLADRSSVYSVTGYAYRRSATMYGVMGAAMLGIAVAVFLNSGPRNVAGYFFATIGASFLFMVAGSVRSARQFRKISGIDSSNPKDSVVS